MTALGPDCPGAGAHGPPSLYRPQGAGAIVALLQTRERDFLLL